MVDKGRQIEHPINVDNEKMISLRSNLEFLVVRTSPIKYMNCRTHIQNDEGSIDTITT